MWSDPETTRFIGGRPSSPQQSWARLLAYVGHWSVMDFGYWAIEERGSGSFAGEIGFADFKRDAASAARGSPELGFVLAPHARGKGFATEAARAVVAWGDARLSSPSTVCLVHAENAASLRVVEKCGYEVVERATLYETPTLVLARHAPRRS